MAIFEASRQQRWPPQRVLVVQTAFLGDVVLALPLVAALHQRFPQAQVDFLTVPAHVPLLQTQPQIAAVLAFDKRGRQRGLRGLLAMARVLRARRYDLALSPHRSWRSALLLCLSGIPRRLGFARWGVRWAYTDTVPRPRSGHEVARNHALLSPLAPPAVPLPARLRLHVPAAARRRVAAALARAGVMPQETLIGLVPGSQWATKRWPPEHFAALMACLRGRLKARFVLLGSPAERPLAEAIVARCPEPVLDLVGRTPLADLPAYVQRCRLLVSNDTALVHVAAAVGTPVVVLYGPTAPALGFFPYGVPWEEASVALPCRPCHPHGPRRCPLRHWRCMRELTAEQVAAKVQRLLAKSALREEG
ncbi:MAG: heptosyltransferase [Candidatus Tectimicrobiota bacterium]|nr:MAG: heptosyltransferase [Candidatus Tectomicrobia bacterium]